MLLRLGLSNAAIGEYSVSLQFLQQAIVFYQELQDDVNKALCLHHIGAVLGRMGNFEEGMQVLKESLKIRTQLQDKLGIADCLEEMGLLCYNIAGVSSCTQFTCFTSTKVQILTPEVRQTTRMRAAASRPRSAFSLRYPVY